MTPIEQLFCTPEQGRRLQELVPELTSTFVWKPDGNLERSAVQRFLSDYPLDHCAPATTLQELFPLFKYSIYSDRATVIVYELVHGTLTAPKLAQWVIERLEDRQ